MTDQNDEIEPVNPMLEAARTAIAALPSAKPEVVAAGDLSVDELFGEVPYIEVSDGAVHVYWGGYDYDIALSDIPTPKRLLGWVIHISDKAWPLMTIDRVGALIEVVCAEKGWDPYSA